MVFSINEIFDAIIITLAIGYIFKDFVGNFVRQVSHRTVYQPYDPLAQYRGHRPAHKGNVWDTILGNKFYLAMLVAAPAIVFHELLHKFVAMGFGHFAVFNAAYTWLAVGVALRLLGIGIIFFVPAYVSILPGAGPITAGQSSLIAFAGPFANLLLWAGCAAYMKWGKPSRKYLPVLFLTRRINGFLFVFNMIPLPFFDGAKVFSGLWSVLF